MWILIQNTILSQEIENVTGILPFCPIDFGLAPIVAPSIQLAREVSLPLMFGA